jgi:hypothetical protein
MYKFKSLALVAIAILFSGVLFAASAQKRKVASAIEPPAPVDLLTGTHKIDVKADQLSTGEVSFDSGSTYGWTCYGVTEGDVAGYIFISMNLSAPRFSRDGGESWIVTGGSWSKLIFIDGQYTGSINGRIVGGQVVSDVTSNAPATTINLQMTGDGGTGAYADRRGSATFEGIVTAGRKGPNVMGTLGLYY